MNKIINEDTIVAQATPHGVGAISVIRISGPESFNATDRIFTGSTKICDAQSHTIHYGRIIANDEVIDDVLVSVFRAPNSYTGEDSVEISTHGSPLVIQKIISLLLMSNDVRIAEPGEFTKRAYLSNRIDLAQAEAVLDVINSRTLASLRGARNQLDGLLSSKVDGIRSNLLNISSFVELELDFAEEEIELIQKNELKSRINNIIDEIDKLAASYIFGRILKDGLNVVIVGEPNVGKSSILNYLLKESRAIVSDIPGTTRDIIREEISLDGLLLKIFDTAGFRSTGEIIEKEGVERSRSAVKNADLILFIGDVEVGFSNQVELELIGLNSSAKIIKILNKIDLNSATEFAYDFKISAKTGEAMDEFIKGMREKVIGENAYTEKDAIVSNLRHYSCLKKAEENLRKAIETIENNFSGEFIATDLRAAGISLSEIIGIVTPDDILNNIFSKFCIGK